MALPSPQDTPSADGSGNAVAAQSPNGFDASYRSFSNYPCNILCTHWSHISLTRRKNALDRAEFDTVTKNGLYVRDILDTVEESPLGHTSLPDAGKVAEFLTTKDRNRNVRWRVITILTKSARGPPRCSKDQLTRLLSYHQVMPSFTDLILTAKNRVQSGPLTHVLFRTENCLEQDSSPIETPFTEKPGYCIQHAFNLLSIEHIDDSLEADKWPIRHTAVFHSFDLRSAKALWIIIKGNAVVTKLLTEDPRMKSGKMSKPSASFSSSLDAHLAIIDHCLQDWNEYIEELDSIIKSKTGYAEIIPANEIFNSKVTERRFRNETKIAPPSRNAVPPIEPKPSIKQASTFPRAFTAPRILSERTLSFSVWGKQLPPAQPAGQPEDNEEEDEAVKEQLDLEKKFSFEKLQELSLLSRSLGRLLDVIDQNLRNIAALKAQYEYVGTSWAFKEFMGKSPCQSSLNNFFRRLAEAEGELGQFRSRLCVLVRTIENERYMFEALNQYANTMTARAFSDLSKNSASQMMRYTIDMRDLAVRTKKETLSMHVITVFTMVFLPGTFLATFFSSGVFNWDEHGTLGKEWEVRAKAMGLFFSICLPLTFLILIGWAMLYRWGAKSESSASVQYRYADEKGGNQMSELSQRSTGEEQGATIKPNMKHELVAHY